jgi:hypothetical protein
MAYHEAIRMLQTDYVKYYNFYQCFTFLVHVFRLEQDIKNILAEKQFCNS